MGAGATGRRARTARQRHAAVGHRHDHPRHVGAELVRRRLSRLPAGDPATRGVLRPRLPDRRLQRHQGPSGRERAPPPAGPGIARAAPRQCRGRRRRLIMPSMKREAIREFFRRLHEGNPEPKTELEYASPYQLLVAVVLSAQATDRSVNLATRKLFAAAPTPEAMVSLGADGVAEHIKTIGLFRNKAKN